jgi:hypothetical protein
MSEVTSIALTATGRGFSELNGQSDCEELRACLSPDAQWCGPVGTALILCLALNVGSAMK